ncbi:MAG: hypothetical protein LBT09_02930 [Planctomycetaceae bacterium]|nr:hypothetical protein [Planctomycetaceae bacterium]
MRISSVILAGRDWHGYCGKWLKKLIVNISNLGGDFELFVLEIMLNRVRAFFVGLFFWIEFCEFCSAFVAGYAHYNRM